MPRKYYVFTQEGPKMPHQPSYIFLINNNQNLRFNA